MIGRHTIAAIAVAGALLLLAPRAGRAGGAPAMRRVAIVVGANAAAPGRKPLRFAHRDAGAVAAVLRELGGFGPDDVRVMLDPEPAAILAALDRALGAASGTAGETMVLFYYSGHADVESLYPAGRPLHLADLRARLEDHRAAVRIGIIDACRGGGWTGTKGLSETSVFDIDNALDLDNEGSVLIASSSGLEDAHESAELRGSFFTHHWNAALRGAADENRDDKVTLVEAFEFARILTIRDTAIHTDAPQHPSFRMALKGRGDPTMSTLTPGRALVELSQVQGPLQVIHLGSGLLVAELQRGPRVVRLQIAPGRYLVRHRAERLRAREVRLAAGRTVRIEEASLGAVDGWAMARKGGGEAAAVSAEPVRAAAGPPSEWQLGFRVARSSYEQRVTYLDPASPREDSRVGMDEAAIMASYLLRTGGHLATSLSAGVGRGDLADHAVLVGLGEQLSWQPRRAGRRWFGLGPASIEPYVAASLTARLETDQEEQEDSFQVQAGLAVGLRFHLLYAQVGGVYDLLSPGTVVEDSVLKTQLVDTWPGVAAEVGLRVVADFD